MSASMYARRPPDPKPQGEYINRHVHGVLALRFFGHDGSRSSGPYPIVRGDADHVFVQGMRAMALDEEMIRDLDVILRLIAEHGGCEIEIIR